LFSSSSCCCCCYCWFLWYSLYPAVSLQNCLKSLSLVLCLSVCLSGRLRQANKDFSSTSGRISASMNPLGKEIRAVPGRLSSGVSQISVSGSLSVCLVVFVKRTKTSHPPVDESQLR
jgi:hypothetical protein